MRAPILGVCLGHDPDRLVEFVRASTRLTHTDERAEAGALLVARATWLAASGEIVPIDLLDLLIDTSSGELSEMLASMRGALAAGEVPSAVAEMFGLGSGVTGFINHTVPLAIYCSLRYFDDFRMAIESAIRLGGDTDTVAAIVGGITGARVGDAAIPGEWSNGIRDWPRSRRWVTRLADRLNTSISGGEAEPLGIFWPGIPFRNLAFLGVVLTHGFRRLLPPW